MGHPVVGQNLRIYISNKFLNSGSIVIGVTNGCSKQGRVRRFYFGESGYRERDGWTMAYGRRIEGNGLY